MPGSRALAPSSAGSSAPAGPPRPAPRRRGGGGRGFCAQPPEAPPFAPPALDCSCLAAAAWRRGRPGRRLRLRLWRSAQPSILRSFCASEPSEWGGGRQSEGRGAARPHGRAEGAAGPCSPPWRRAGSGPTPRPRAAPSRRVPRERRRAGRGRAVVLRPRPAPRACRAWAALTFRAHPRRGTGTSCSWAGTAGVPALPGTPRGRPQRRRGRVGADGTPNGPALTGQCSGAHRVLALQAPSQDQAVLSTALQRRWPGSQPPAQPLSGRGPPGRFPPGLSVLGGEMGDSSVHPRVERVKRTDACVRSARRPSRVSGAGQGARVAFRNERSPTPVRWNFADESELDAGATLSGTAAEVDIW